MLSVASPPLTLLSAASVAFVPFCANSPTFLVACLVYGFSSVASTRTLFRSVHVVAGWRPKMGAARQLNVAATSTVFAGVGGILSLPVIKYLMEQFDHLDPMVMYLDVLEGTAGVIALGALADLVVVVAVARATP